MKFSVVTDPVPGLTEVLSVPFSILKLLLFHLFLECQHPASKLTLNAAFRDEICPGGRHVPQGLITTCSAMSKAYESHLLGKVPCYPQLHMCRRITLYGSCLSAFEHSRLSNSSSCYIFFLQMGRGSHVLLLSAALLFQKGSKLFSLLLQLIPFLLHHTYGSSQDLSICFAFHFFVFKPNYLIF